MLPIIEEYMPRMMESATPSGQAKTEAGARIGAVMARLVVIGGIVFFCVWGLVKLTFYGLARRYLQRDAVRELFASQPASTI